MRVNRDCLFYGEYQDMGAKADICTVKGSSMDVMMEGCHCDDCPNYYSLSWMRYILRQSIKEKGEHREPETN